MFHVDAMLVLLCFFAILKSIVSEEMCVAYSFTDDFYRSFSKKECSDDVSWDLVNYSDAGVPLPSNVSVSGIKGTDRSCSTSFELVVYSGSSLELQVFSSGRCGVVVSVLSALQGSDDPVQTKTFEPEELPEAQWSLVSMEIGRNSSHNGYVSDDFLYKYISTLDSEFNTIYLVIHQLSLLEHNMYSSTADMIWLTTTFAYTFRLLSEYLISDAIL